MSNIKLKLTKTSSGSWHLIGPKGNVIGPSFRSSDLFHVREQARLFVSSWYNWTVDDSECYSKEEKAYELKKNRVFRTTN